MKNQPFNFMSFTRSPQLKNLSSHKGSTILPNLQTHNTLNQYSKVQIDPRIKEKSARLNLDVPIHNLLTPVQSNVMNLQTATTVDGKVNNFLN